MNSWFRLYASNHHSVNFTNSSTYLGPRLFWRQKHPSIPSRTSSSPSCSESRTLWPCQGSYHKQEKFYVPTHTKGHPHSSAYFIFPQQEEKPWASSNTHLNNSLLFTKLFSLLSGLVYIHSSFMTAMGLSSGWQNMGREDGYPPPGQAPGASPWPLLPPATVETTCFRCKSHKPGEPVPGSERGGASHKPRVLILEIWYGLTPLDLGGCILYQLILPWLICLHHQR